MIVDPSRRATERSWFEEFDALEGEGFAWRSDHDCSLMHKSVCIRCGEDMEVRMFERRDISYRAYALCVMCCWWFEL